MKPLPACIGKQAMSKIRHQAQILDEGCRRCQACVTRCAFLQKNGTPGDIAASLLAGDSTVDPFVCSLCTLCTAICPNGIAPGAFFLEMRRQVVDSNQLSFKPYTAILGYERRGSSRLFSWQGLPAHCDTVFFPGCALPGARLETTWGIYQQLAKQIPHLGMVLDCCHKPSHDLGLQQYFLSKFKAMQDRFVSHGIRHVIVACPNCYKVFQRYGQGLTIQTAWEILAENHINTAPPTLIRGRVTVHDPCPLRDHHPAHQAVRTILTQLGIEVREMRHSRSHAICCGEGGSVGCVNPDMAQRWRTIRKNEAGDNLIITYCAGCTAFLAKAGMRTVHLGDLLLNPEKAFSGKSFGPRPPWTYLNRIRIKKRTQKTIPTRNKMRT